LLDDFVWIPIGFRPPSYKRDHQFLCFDETRSEVVQAQLTQPSLCFSYQLRFPQTAVSQRALLSFLRGSERWQRLTGLRVGISHGASGQQFLKLLLQTGVILLQRWPPLIVGGFVHRSSISALPRLVRPLICGGTKFNTRILFDHGLNQHQPENRSSANPRTS